MSGLRRTVRPAIVVVAVALVAAGCGSSSTRSDPAASSVAASRATASAVSSAPSAPPSSRTTSKPVATVPSCAAKVINAMTLREKLGQLIVTGVTGTADAQQVVANYGVGGIFYGSWTDPSLLQGGLAQVRDAARYGLMVTVDQEGGRVSRLASFGIDAPAARDLAATMTVDQVRALGAKQGAEMRKLGITVDFAPDADVSDQPADAVIGDRSFSNDPRVVTEYAAAYARGLLSAGITPVFKHFPGHGHSDGDSHLGTVTVPPLAQLVKSDLVPYRTLLQIKGAAAMVGHMTVPGLSDQSPTSSTSARVYTMLRTGKGYGGPRFNGLVFTDDVGGMAAVTSQMTVPQAVVRAIRAGADIALFIATDTVGPSIDALEAAVKDGQIPQSYIDRKVTRVLTAKKVVCG